MKAPLLCLLLLCLMATVFAGDIIPVVDTQQKAAIVVSFRRLKNVLSTPGASVPSSFQCPPLSDKKKATVGGGDVKRHSNYFLGPNYKLAASCRLDCMSKVSGKVHFDGGCKHRFYYYANTGSCLVAGEVNDAQAKLAEAYCMNCNGCVKTHNRPFDMTTARKSQGDNSGKLPQ
ncbi:hypothetical protein AKO1_013677 [Acrasis kona]|uniref:Secreted protein n=1 Tax=Acrasis kona TaxID=1008807 RepID=A0AAW2YL29_9EUKA